MTVICLYDSATTSLTTIVQIPCYNWRCTNEEAIKYFVRNSSILIFLHHIIVLSVIMILMVDDPTFLAHWKSSEFQLKPADRDVFYIFGFTMLMGLYSLTVILYRAEHLTKISVQPQKPEENED